MTKLLVNSDVDIDRVSIEQLRSRIHSRLSVIKNIAALIKSFHLKITTYIVHTVVLIANVEISTSELV